MAERLADLQRSFAAHIRDPQHAAMPEGIEERRMQIYRRLFFNNIRQFLASSFPVLRRIYSDEAWSALMRDFFVEYRAQTPLFPEMPKEFLRYLEEVRKAREGDPPWLLELAHYEWVEQALSQDACDLDEFARERLVDPQGDLLTGIPVVSPLAWSLAYRFPVHRIGPDFQPAEASATATQLLVYRNRADEVKFMLLNEVTQLLLALIRERPDLAGRPLLELVATHIAHLAPAVVIDNGLRLLDDLRSRDVILGTRRVDSAQES